MSHEGSTNTRYSWDGSYQTVYPPSPSYSDQCVNNLNYDTLPNGYPMRKTILGPTSLKHLYKSAQYYPPQSMQVPDNTLYGTDFSSFHGANNEKRRTYQQKLYPFTHRSPREVVESTDQILPMPAIEGWTQYRTLTDGAWGR